MRSEEISERHNVFLGEGSTSRSRRGDEVDQVVDKEARRRDRRRDPPRTARLRE